MDKQSFDLQKWVRRSRKACSVPPKVQDEQTLLALAQLFRISKKS